jgi:hypothetical protein
VKSSPPSRRRFTVLRFAALAACAARDVAAPFGGCSAPAPGRRSRGGFIAEGRSIDDHIGRPTC